MSGITINDGKRICYNDWGTEQPVVFSHGWPLSADDLATLVETLDLQNAIRHSMGGGEVARYIGRHSTKRVAKGVLIGSCQRAYARAVKR